MTPTWNPTTILTAALAALALIAAVTLQVLHDDPSRAWEAFGGFAVFFGGIHVPSPSQTT